MNSESDPHHIIVGLLLVILVIIILMVVFFVIFILSPLQQIATRINRVIDQIEESIKNFDGTAQDMRNLSASIPQFKGAFCQFVPTLPFCNS